MALEVENIFLLGLRCASPHLIGSLSNQCLGSDILPWLGFAGPGFLGRLGCLGFANAKLTFAGVIIEPDPRKLCFGSIRESGPNVN